MVALRISPFGGMIPAVDDRLLPDTAAAYAENTWVYPGTVKGMPELKTLRTNSSSAITKVYRLPNNFIDREHLGDSFFMEFQDSETDVIRSLVIDDTFDRYYWVSPSERPKYNPRARIEAGLPAFFLGIEQPAPIINVVAAGGASSTLISRAYVHTYVSAYGEESQPSDPFLLTGKKLDDTFTLTLPAANPLDLGTNRNLTRRRIYRTVTATNGTTTYYLVVDLPIATTTYADNASDAVVSLKSALQSTNWNPPPEDLKGWITMSNGMVAGFRENEIWFCEPFRMHAWPAIYTLVVEYPIVGLGVTDQSLIVCTEGFPHVATGTRPEAITVAKVAGLLPCTSRGSIISTVDGVFFSSSEGLVLANAGGVNVVTKELIRKDKWLQLVTTSTLRAVRLGAAYYAFGAARFGIFEETAFEETAFEQEDLGGAKRGLLIDPTSQIVAFNLMSSEDPVSNIFMDAWSGEVFVIKGNKTMWLDISDTQQRRGPFVWRSKIFQPSIMKNFQAMKVYFNVLPNTPALNPVPDTALVQSLKADQWGLVRLYADGRHVFTRELRKSGEQFRLPSGFRADFWQWEIEARVEIDNIQAATSPTELRTV